ncbi:hypothetical protein [Bartonella sp. A05]|uniref:hypothetical protein n=1 Tax=Bartonella sp. A05 TaxID=2967261 RepID=UPI0022A90633|nr:hypothetical protein [Bartonella sp. A05]MCZ2204402.1 hypothetical protein [Bartonella sp. A05]
MNVWLSSKIGAPAANIMTSLIFLTLMIVAIVITIMFLRHLNKGKHSINRKEEPVRLSVRDIIAIDQKRHLILIRRDNMEHLILTGGSTDIVIESNNICTHTTQKSDHEPHRDTPIMAEMTETNENSGFIENTHFSKNDKEPIRNDPFSPFMKQNSKVSEITAEIEERQEPSLFIPPLRK